MCFLWGLAPVHARREAVWGHAGAAAGHGRYRGRSAKQAVRGRAGRTRAKVHAAKLQAGGGVLPALPAAGRRRLLAPPLAPLLLLLLLLPLLLLRRQPAFCQLAAPRLEHLIPPLLALLHLLLLLLRLALLAHGLRGRGER